MPLFWKESFARQYCASSNECGLVAGDEASRDIGSPASAIGHLAGDFAKKLQDKRLAFFSVSTSSQTDPKDLSCRYP